MMVVEMFSLGWGVDGEAWKWQRQLWAWEEEMLRECQTLLLNFTLQVHSSDRWQWQPNPVDGYTVRGAYQLLTSHDSATMDGRVGSSSNHLLQYLWTPVDFSMLVDRRHLGFYHFHTRSICSVYMVGRWISGAAFLYAAHLAGVCLSHVDGKKSSLISRLNKQFPSVAGQDQAFLL
ncbi:hypothetical protein TSUD_157040 [Trifolium subterraneum]|uniref:Uncharacterized protein n=1 Tax=Trifolium subterraneum TaxID=3900 RepID=A0A2Z6LYP8_TRISU|nr:hypothetical protein TSUD_157040 [Trifolium subterraneum]